MKFAIPISALFLLLGMTASTYALQEKGQDQHQHDERPQESKPPQKTAKPPQQHTQQQSKVPQRQHAAQQAKPVQQQHSQQQQHAQPQQQQHTQQQSSQRQQQSDRTQRPQTQTANHSQQRNGEQEHAQQSNRENQNRGEREHGRIPDDRYRSNFGSEHRFHVRQSDYEHRRFQYGGYTFVFIDPWPVDWSYSDDVYVEYVDDGYYMYDPFHPGVRIAISIQ